MAIDKIFEKIIGPLEGNGEIKVSLFVVSKNCPRLKKLDLSGLTPEQRAAKLHKWAQNCRFVAVVERGDQVFAHANAKFAEQLQKQDDLAVEGKKVTVKVLTEEEYEQLNMVGEAFEDYVLHPEKEEEDKKAEKKKKIDYSILPYFERQYLATSYLVSDQMHMQYLIAKMENVPGQVILNCLQRMNEAHREMEKIKEADEKYFDIRKQEIRKDILRSEIKQGEMKSQEINRGIIGADQRRLKSTRSLQR